MAIELTSESFFKILDEARDSGALDNYGYSTGLYEGKDFIILESCESERAITAYISGYRGNLNIASLYYKQDLNEELDKAVIELEQAIKDKPEHYGTHYRLEKTINSLSNLSAYLRWLHDNEVEELDFDDFGIDSGYADEYDLCCHCGQEVVRTSADCYQWTPPLFLDCEGWVCDNCAPNYNDHILEEYCNVEKSIPDQFNPTDLGLVQVNKDSYQNGLHEGMNDSPQPIIKNLNAQGIDVWFVVQPSQFYYEFDVYVKEADEDQATAILNGTNTYQGYSNVANLEKCLKSCAGNSSNEGIVYNNCDISTGTVETKIISRDDFVEKGIK